jgi:hypothetical protein
MIVENRRICCASAAVNANPVYVSLDAWLGHSASPGDLFGDLFLIARVVCGQTASGSRTQNHLSGLV